MRDPRDRNPKDEEQSARAYFGAHAKRELRTRMRSLRAVLPSAAAAERSRAATERVLELPEYASARTIVAFSAIQREADPAEILRSARASGKRVGLPRVADELLELHEFGDVSELEEGAFGVLEPKVTARLIAPSEVDLVIVPGLAFDPRGHRLGYGRAFYDRLLPHMPQVFRVGFAYEFQVVMELPDDPHDVPMHAVVTDQRVLRVPL